MKVLAVADVHSHKSAVKALKEQVKFSELGLIVVCGDLTHFGNREDAKEIVKAFGFGNILVIPGNVDQKSVLDFLEEKNISLHGKVRTAEGWALVGFGGAENAPGETIFSAEEIFKGAEKLIVEPERTILFTHSPPVNTLLDKTSTGKHIGSVGVRKLVEEKRPAYAFFGHCHEAKGEMKLKETVCVNIGPLKWGNAVLIELGEELEWKRIQLK